MSTRSTSGTPMVVVHGGAAVRQYRDVLDALERALALSADMFEFDVRRAADGTLVVHHDENISGRVLAALPYRDAAALTTGLGYALPRFADVLSRARGRIRLDVELKVTGIEEAVLRAVFDHGFTHDDVVFTSFEEPAVRAVRSLDQGARTGLLVWDVTGPQALELFQKSGTDFLGPDFCILDEATLRAAEANGIPLMPWTVNDAPAMARLLAAPSVIGVITDDPSQAIRERDELQS